MRSLIGLMRVGAIVGAMVGALPGGAAAAASCATGPDIVCTESGAVRGSVEGATLAFKGIPYAKAPVAALRWRPPLPAEPWTGIRDGANYGSICPQVVNGALKGDEDCLFINVWRPREAPQKPLPVMIWLTGGGNHSYSGAGSFGLGGVVYNGHALVPEGVVVVTYNPRLGVFGFLASPAFDAERPERISGNYASLDQVAMLNWVHRNIAAFGGDPDHVFVFGTSAGGGNICALLSSPLTHGLIQGASMESSIPSGCEFQTLAEVEAGTGARVTKALGCDGASDVAACLREKPTQEVLAAVPGTLTVLPRVYGPNVDGYIFPAEPIARIKAGEVPKIPIIIGNTAGETFDWGDTAGKVTDAASYQAAIARVFGAAALDAIIAMYPPDSFASPRAAFVQATTDAGFTCRSRRVAAAFAQAGTPVYRYLFDHALDNDPVWTAHGPVHTVEHMFFFNWEGSYKPSAGERDLQGQIIGDWTRMAKTGNPNGAGAPNWPTAGPNGDVYMAFTLKAAVKSGPASAHCAEWDALPVLWPHM